MNRQAICDVLNSLEVIERQGGEDAYILVADNPVNRQKLIDVGVSEEEIGSASDSEGTFCILATALNGAYADDYENGKFIVWGPIGDDFRFRILNGGGTPADAIRFLRMLEPDIGDVRK
ncbi:hypothetical protein [Paenibacillus cymbidii]|uniref:hypothetical protein n=1 Tax=Paenibacillus cymbidii TaxID=1639034 RepID=UPI00108211E7|nr:hypothetical protein [Paenibacillus cymbidii]